MTTPAPEDGGVVAALDAVAGFRPSRRRLDAWAEVEPVLAGLSWTDLQQELLDRTVDYDRKDALLAGLIRLARSDPDAMAALLYCLSPGLRRAAGRLVANLGREDGWAEVHAGFCAAVMRYDLEARPSKIAVHLISAAVDAVRAAVTADRRWCDRHDLAADPPAPAGEDPVGVELILDHAAQGGVIAPVDAALIAATRLAGLTIREAADLIGIDPEAAKKRRQRAEPALAAWWLATTEIPDHIDRAGRVLALPNRHNGSGRRRAA